jgi:hypothetical protein
MPPKWVAVVQEIAKAKNVRGEFLDFAPIEPEGWMRVAYAAHDGDVAADGRARTAPAQGMLAHIEEPGVRAIPNLQTFFRYTIKPEDSATLS